MRSGVKVAGLVEWCSTAAKLGPESHTPKPAFNLNSYDPEPDTLQGEPKPLQEPRTTKALKGSVVVPKPPSPKPLNPKPLTLNL